MATRTDDPTGPEVSARLVGELWMRVARERGLDFEPAPAAVTDALPVLVHIVDGLVTQWADVQERRWLAAALAALSHHVQAGTLPDEIDRTDPRVHAGGAPSVVQAGSGGGVAVAVVSCPSGVLVGRRRDGIPRWVFPGGRIEQGETPAQTAQRECAEETGLRVVAGQVIGQRVHPVTGQPITYLACAPEAGTDVSVGAPEELVEVRWLPRDQIDDLMPDLHGPVRDHLDQCAATDPDR